MLPTQPQPEHIYLRVETKDPFQKGEALFRGITMITAEGEDSDKNAGMCKVPTIAMHRSESFRYINSFNTHNTSII